MNLSHFEPRAENFLYLKRNTYISLKESLLSFCELPSVLTDGNIFCIKKLNGNLKKEDSLFPIMLLNHVMVSHYEDNNNDLLNECIEDFFHNYKLNSFSDIIKYKNGVFSQKYWKICDGIIKSSFSEPVQLTEPSYSQFEDVKKNINTALVEIKKIDPILFEEIKVFNTNYAVINSNRFIAGSTFPLIGLIGLADTHNVEALIDLIVHEDAHQYIYHLTVFDEVCEGDGLYKSPLRSDPRPIEGIYHSVYVLARLIYFYNKAKKTMCCIDDEKINTVLTDYNIKFNDGYGVLKEHAKLTKLGENLLRSCKDKIDFLSCKK